REHLSNLLSFKTRSYEQSHFQSRQLATQNFCRLQLHQKMMIELRDAAPRHQREHHVLFGNAISGSMVPSVGGVKILFFHFIKQWVPHKLNLHSMTGVKVPLERKQHQHLVDPFLNLPHSRFAPSPNLWRNIIDNLKATALEL